MCVVRYLVVPVDLARVYMKRTPAITKKETRRAAAAAADDDAPQSTGSLKIRGPLEIFGYLAHTMNITKYLWPNKNKCSTGFLRAGTASQPKISANYQQAARHPHRITAPSPKRGTERIPGPLRRLCPLTQYALALLCNSKNWAR